MGVGGSWGDTSRFAIIVPGPETIRLRYFLESSNHNNGIMISIIRAKAEAPHNKNIYVDGANPEVIES